MPELTITLRQILDAGPCYDPRDRGLLEKDHPLDAPISLLDIYTVCGYLDTIWCFAAIANEKMILDFITKYIARITTLLPIELKAQCEYLLDRIREYVDGKASFKDLLFDMDLYKDLAEGTSPDDYNSYRAMQAAHVTIDMTKLEISSLRAAEALAWEQTEQAVAGGALREGLYSRFLEMAIAEQINDLFEIIGIRGTNED
jgi:hypothetical protein